MVLFKIIRKTLYFSILTDKVIQSKSNIITLSVKLENKCVQTF